MSSMPSTSTSSFLSFLLVRILRSKTVLKTGLLPLPSWPWRYTEVASGYLEAMQQYFGMNLTPPFAMVKDPEQPARAVPIWSGAALSPLSYVWPFSVSWLCETKWNVVSDLNSRKVARVFMGQSKDSCIGNINISTTPSVCLWNNSLSFQ